jgi:ferredoxin-NADP reductase
MTATDLNLVVTDITRHAPAILGFTLAAPDGAALPGFVPGSHLMVAAGPRTNAYSLTSDGVDPAEYRISVLRVADSNGGSHWMHDHLRVGDTVAVQPPRSAFAPVSRAVKHLLIAGGIGITPILSHLRAARRWGRDVRVLYVFRDGHGAHVDDVGELAGSAAELFTGRRPFADRLPSVLANQRLGTHLYVCGPAALIDHVTSTAAGLGWPGSRIHLERFGADVADPGDPFTVVLTESGRTLEVPSGTSLLKALEDNGVQVPNLCRHGVCGECRIPVTRGTPAHRDLYLTDAEKRAGHALMPCVSRASKGATLEVPL